MLPFFIEYVQATGRGGRDGKTCHCILFYRQQDCGVVKNVLRFNYLDNEDKKRYMVSIDNVCKVRYSYRWKKIVTADSHFLYIC